MRLVDWLLAAAMLTVVTTQSESDGGLRWAIASVTFDSKTFAFPCPFPSSITEDETLLGIGRECCESYKKCQDICWQTGQYTSCVDSVASSLASLVLDASPLAGVASPKHITSLDYCAVVCTVQ